MISSIQRVFWCISMMPTGRCMPEGVSRQLYLRHVCICSTCIATGLFLGSQLFPQYFISFPAEISSLPNGFGTPSGPFQDSPSVSIVVRTYGASAVELVGCLIMSWNIFWPGKSFWPNSELVVVWDDESLMDHRYATVLAYSPPFPRMMFEQLPPTGTLCTKWRSEGYCRQQYSTMW